jgi:hypothetical protein
VSPDRPSAHSRILELTDRLAELEGIVSRHMTHAHTERAQHRRIVDDLAQRLAALERRPA